MWQLNTGHDICNASFSLGQFLGKSASFKGMANFLSRISVQTTAGALLNFVLYLKLVALKSFGKSDNHFEEEISFILRILVHLIFRS